ncbi:hypothetical protein C8Q78DRAFT_1073304 [Trametes maxima]|nr:hypothetical protein C8Q78DRAFT_1073304 [Trametes maxima]
MSPAPPSYDPAPFQELLGVLLAKFEHLETRIFARFDRTDATLGSVAKVAADALQISSGVRQESREGLERLQVLVLNAVKCSRTEAEALRAILRREGTDDEEGGRRTVFDQMQEIERAVVELAEGVGDPDAARPTIVRHEAAVNTQTEERSLVDVGVDALDLQPPVLRADVAVQAQTSTFVDTAVDARTPSPPRPAVTPQWAALISHAHTNGGDGGLFSPLAPFTAQPLTMAQWTPQRSCANGSSNSTSSSSSPSLDNSNQGGDRQPSPTHKHASASLSMLVPKPNLFESRASSTLDEQEIDASLAPRAGTDTTSRATSPPPPLLTPIPAPAPASKTIPAPTTQPPSPPPPTQTVPTRVLPPLPRRRTISQLVSPFKPTPMPASADPVVPPATSASASTSSTSSGGTEAGSPARSLSQLPRHPDTQQPQKQKTSPPLPRRSMFVSAATSSALFSTPAATPASGSSSAQTASPGHTSLPLPRGREKDNLAVSASAGSVSPLSSLPQSSPSASAPVPPSAAQRAVSRDRSDSLSSLSSVPTPPQSQTKTPPSRTKDGAGPSSSLHPSEPSSSFPSSSSFTPAAAASDSSSPTRLTSVPAPSASTSSGRSRSVTRGRKSYTAGRVSIKKKAHERGRDEEGDVPGRRLAKRRKTQGDAGTGERISSASRGGSRARGGRGAGRGGSMSAAPAAAPRKSAAADGEKNKAKVKGRGKGAPKYEVPRIGTDCPWPNKIEGDEAYQREFVQCDSCEGWYHFGCVGLQVDDPRLEPNAEFICPPCGTSDAIRAQRQGLRFKEAACVRPDCDRPGLAEDTQEYFVERIIGRRPYDADLATGVKRPTRFLWLVKWDGWKTDFASWTEREHLGDCARLIEEFEQAAEIEGRKLERLDHIVVLNEAAAAGW